MQRRYTDIPGGTGQNHIYFASKPARRPSKILFRTRPALAEGSKATPFVKKGVKEVDPVPAPSPSVPVLQPPLPAPPAPQPVPPAKAEAGKEKEEESSAFQAHHQVYATACKDLHDVDTHAKVASKGDRILLCYPMLPQGNDSVHMRMKTVHPVTCALSYHWVQVYDGERTENTVRSFSFVP